MDNTAMDRRQFLHCGLMATSLVATGRLPLLGDESSDASGIDSPEAPYAVKPVRDHLPRFSPSTAAVQGRRQTLHYDIVHWHWGRTPRTTHENTVIGHVTIDRGRTDDGAIYEVAQKTKVGGADSVIEARITCRTDQRHSVRAWRVKSFGLGRDGRPDPLSQLIEEGRCEDGRIKVEGDGYHYEYRPRHPVLTQWQMPDALPREPGVRRDITLDLLEDASLFKPDQHVTYDGKVRVAVARGRTVTLDTYAQTGYGILPTHYLVDTDGRVQLVTRGVLSWALQGRRESAVG